MTNTPATKDRVAMALDAYADVRDMLDHFEWCWNGSERRPVLTDKACETCKRVMERRKRKGVNDE